MSSDRNYELAQCWLDGGKLSPIAERYGITHSHALLVAKKNVDLVRRCDGRPIPEGLTARAALAIFDAIGLWPSESDKSEVEQRAMDIMRSPSGHRVILKEIGAWLYGCPEERTRSGGAAGQGD